MSEPFMPQIPSTSERTEPTVERTGRSAESPAFRSVIADLRDSIHDRTLAAHPERNGALPIFSPDTLDGLDESQFSALAENTAILRSFNGHRGQRLRELAKTSGTPETVHLLKLLSWSRHAADTADHALDAVFFTKPPKILLARSADPESLAEYLAFASLHPETPADGFEAEILRQTCVVCPSPSHETGWSGCAAALFSGRDIRSSLKSLLARVGCIPSGMLSDKAFALVPPKQVVRAIDALRSLEDDASLGKQARYERSKLINHLFLARQADGIRTDEKSVTLDANGLFINLRNFHSHLPYGLIRPETIGALSKNGWLSQDEILEADLRGAEANRETDRSQAIANVQSVEFGRALKLKTPDAESTVRELTAMVLERPESIAKEILRRKLVVPDQLVRNLIALDPPQGISALAEMAESLGQSISGESLYREPDLFSSHRLLQSTQEAYDSRSEVLNAPEYYNVVKIARSILDEPLRNDLRKRFIVFHGQHKKNKGGQQHTFFDIYHQNSGSRILLNEEKHLNDRQRSALHGLPHLERGQYEKFENALKVFDYYCSTIGRMRKVIARKAKNWRKNVETLSETALHFVLGNVTGYYQTATGLREAFLKDPDNETIAADLLDIFETARANYEEFLYAHAQNTSGLMENISPEIEEKKIVFDMEYFDQARERMGAGNFRSEIGNRETPFSTRVALIHYQIHDPSQTVPFHIEESCLDAIRINRGRPLINVIGGCRHLDGSDPLEEFGVAVMRVGHECKANIGIPGTQSGIGNTFGIQNIHYQNRFGHIPHRDRAHFFAINPGGNVFFPGNPYGENTPKEEVFAAAPIDTIVTPCSAGWELQGKDRLHSPYLNHIAYMESLYRRIAGDQPKIMVVGNGGLYSIVEINESLRQGFDLLLLRDSGRFAEAASSILEAPEMQDMSRDPESIAKTIIDRIRTTLTPEVSAEFLRKDFGFDPIPENDNYLVYRMYFFEFLKMAAEKRDRIRTAGLRDLESSLRDMIEANRTNPSNAFAT